MKQFTIAFIILALAPLLFHALKKWFDSVKSHKHNWQRRGQNRWGTTTYRVCLKCREAQKRVNGPFEEDKWETCDPIGFLDEQFDENDQFIFNRK